MPTEAVGSPLSRTVGFNKAYQRWRGQGLGGEDASLELEAEATEGISTEHNFCGLCMNDLPAWPYGAGGQ